MDTALHLVRQHSAYLCWLLLAVLMGVVAVCLITLGDSGWGFLPALASAVAFLVASTKEPTAAAKTKAIKLHAVLERQLQEWNAIIEELERLRRELRRSGHSRLAGECDEVMREARLEQRGTGTRMREHREAFNTAYWIYQNLDQRGRPNYKYVIHRGPCDLCNHGERKPFLDMKRWDGPYDEWEHAQGVGTRRFCLACCSDLRERRLAKEDGI